MEKAIFYKEWVKMRGYWGIIFIVSLCFVAYALLKVNRIAELKGAAHVWEVILQKGVVLIDVLQYFPLLAGIGLGVVQFVPEMVQKRLKLTLHLPYPHNRMVLLMLAVGTGLLAVIWAVHGMVLWIFLRSLLSVELTVFLLGTVGVWYLAGVLAYFFTAWICLEPVWKQRVIELVIAGGILRIFFLSEVPLAYYYVLGGMTVYIVSAVCFPLLSVKRFKAGQED